MLFYNLFSKEAKIEKGITEQPIVDLVDSLLIIAIEYSVSDIHLEQTQDELKVRYRIDGILYDQNPVNQDYGESIISRLKILSGLDIAQKRMPQDGKILVSFIKDSSGQDNKIDMRISTFPTIYGEKMVIRILDKEQNKIDLNCLGMPSEVLTSLYNLIDRPYGFFLLTGPTGSGKTTTLYSILSYLNNGEKNIVTMEDPVEYNIDGIIQSQINEKAGFTFEKGLRSILRQDPDVIMIGEIRDKVTAKIAIESALTGHLVFSTLHTNDTVSAINRLIDMGVEPFLVNAALTGVLSQRLVRKLCTNCMQQDIITIQEKEFIKNKNINLDKFNLDKINRPCGCASCYDLGYKGRIGIFELLKVDDNIRDFVAKKATESQIKEFLISQNMQFLQGSALKLVEAGVISLEEFFKAISL
ncbi:MAG: Type IV pilus assembly protein PilB [candidate division TM6 bacterium GW2011_GWF2_28_16]|nr:MAG: Type IV pilus assembly protein PilB [candidate division TM6 bacterium GW2011_GWF2_28_16]